MQPFANIAAINSRNTKGVVGIMSTKRKKIGRPKAERKSNVNLYLVPDLLNEITNEAKQWTGGNISKYVAFVLLYRDDVVKRLESGELRIP